MHTSFHKGIIALVASGLWLCLGATAEARLGPQYQTALGNPDGASTNSASRTKFLINQRSQYAISYNDDTHQANWVSWSYSLADDGSQARTDAWATEELLPSGYLKIGTSSFGTSYGIGWDRGHMCPSADRTKDLTNNQVTFRMSNIIPQADANNQGLWAQFEDYCRTIASSTNEILITSGPASFTGNRIGNSMSVPGSVWKIAVIVPNATSTTPANQRITTSARVIAILTPNVSSGLGTWQSYITSVEQIEEVTGMNFFTEIDPSTAIYLKNLVDTGTAPNNPTVLTTFGPSLGAPGTAVTISGYNFNASSTVQFNGVAAASVTYVSANQLTALVPVGATTGPITVTGPGGSDTSYEDFTVTSSGSTPTISLSQAALSGLAATQGAAGTAQIYAVNGTYLTDDIVVTASANFEISADGVLFASSLMLPRAIDGTLSKQIHVRIKSDAPVGDLSGSITHTSNGAATRTLTVAGKMSPNILLSTTSLNGFAALQGSAGSTKSYTVSGGNLGGDITITAPSGYELSLDNSTFAATRTLAASGGTVPTTIVHVRLTSSAPLGAVMGSITHQSSGATTQLMSVAGTVTTPGGSPEKLAGWEVTSISNFGPSPFIPTSSNSVATSGGLTRGSGVTASGTAAAGAWGGAGFDGATNAADAVALGNYVSFSVSSSLAVSFTEIPAHNIRRSTSGPPNGQWQYQVGNGTFSNIGTPITWSGTSSSGNAQTAINLSTIAALQTVAPDTTVTFRLVPYGATSSGGTFYINNISGDDLAIFGSFGSAPNPAPVITVAGPASATALVSFSYQIVATNNPTSYAASGLPPGLSINTTSGVISGTPTTPGAYTVGLTASNANGDGTATLTINVQANPNAPAITSNLIVYGQINTAFAYQIVATNSPTSYTAANLPDGLSINTSTGSIGGAPTTGGTFNATITAINAFGSDSKTLQIIVRVPSLTLTPATLNAFTANAGFPSATQSYTLTGSELTDGITVRAPQYFEISTDGVNFTGETTLSPAANGSLSQAFIVRVANTAPPGLNNGAISHSGSGAVPKYLEVSATVSTSVPTLTLSATDLANFSTVAGTASTIQTYEVSGAGLSGKITITPPAGFEVGASEGNFGDLIELTPVNGALTATAVYVRIRADASTGTYSGNIVHSGGGAVTKTVAVSGTVTTPIGPNIVSTSGGSAYVSTSYSYAITTDGLQGVTSYGASNLPTGVTINATNGVISGTPTAAGTYNLTLRATGAQGTSTKAYTLRVITTAEQPSTPTVVVNKYQNTTTDRVELLVIGDNLNGPPVDLRGMIIKDFNSNMATDSGGKYVFANHPFWSKVKAGTLIVLSPGNTLAEDLDASDFVLSVNLANATYFTEESGGFDIGNIDMVMIKPAGMFPDGAAGGMHAVAAGTAGSQYNNFTGRKARSTRELSGFRGYFCSIVNANSSLADFYLSTGGETSLSKTFGSGNNSNNTSYINSLRALDQDGPAITLRGSNPASITRGGTYSDAGADAFDAGDNASKTVITTGTVDTSTTGAYTLNYTATDSKGNIGTATRTVNVLAPASTPPAVSTSAASAVTATSATLNGTVTAAGTSAVSARGFLYSTLNTVLQVGAEGVSNGPSGSGTGAFAADISGLSGGTLYYFRSYATSAAGTSYGETLSFTTPKAEPLQHADAFTAGVITTTNIPATWTPVQADGYLLVVSLGAQSTPVDGVPVADDTNVDDGSGAINLSGAANSYGLFTGFVPGETYTFRLYPFNNSGASIDYRTTGAPSFTAGVLTTPTLHVSGTLTPLSTTYGTPSSAATFTLSGNYLTSTVNVTAPAGFEVSADNASFEPSVTLTPSDGILAATTLYLRLAATAGVAGNHNAKALSVSGGGAETVTVMTANGGNTVSPKTITVIGLNASDKIYDGGTEVSVGGTPAYDGLVNTESFPVSGSVIWAFADKNAGSGKLLVRTGNFDAPSANYTVALQPSLTANITAKELTVAGASVTTRTYDGTSAATITGATLAGVASTDAVTVSGSGTFNSANVGVNKPVTANLLLGGADASNYTLVQPALTGTITKADQTITFGSVPAKNTGDAPFQISGSASSGLPVAYTSSNPAVASVSGTTVTVLSAGTTTITAAQAGDGNYNAATSVGQLLVVTDLPALIAGWDFQTTSNGGTAAASNNNIPLLYIANFGSGSLHLDGNNGASTWVPTNEVTAFSGTTTNAGTGFSTTTSGPSALALAGGTSNSANGKSLVFKFGMEGRKNLNVSYATRGSSSGFTTHTWYCSTNASNWTEINIQTGRTSTNYAAINLPVITNVDGAPQAYLRLTVTGATSASGNNRLDNIQLNASSATPADTNAPVITILGDNPLVLAVGSTFNDPSATATDNVDGSVTVTSSGSVNTAIPGSYTITYSAIDAAGNTASATRTVNVVDTTAPVITVLGDNPLVLAVGSTFNDPGATATDNVDGSVAVAASGLVNAAVVGTYTINYSAIDAAGNTASATRTVNVVDTTAPVITVLGDNPLVLAVGSTFNDPGATATDNVDGSVTVASSGSVNTAVVGTYTINYSAIDAAGNTASATRAINVLSRADYLLGTLYGLTGARALLSADADNDGVVNLMEYAFGADPSLPSSTPTSPAARLSQGSLRIAAIVRNDDNQLGFAAKAASNLGSAWTTNNVSELGDVDQTGVPGGFRRRVWEATETNQPAQFMLLEVNYP
ncbi:MAG: hypothetical protein RIQ71_1078 [Verrucomicrobiota bacterium]